MEPVRLAELAAWVGAQVPQDRDPDGLAGPDVVVDSRLVTPGAVFVALPGERADGHDFVAAAAESGAAAAVVRRPLALPDAGPVAQLVVADPLAALAGVARGVLARERRHLTVVGLTGSSGKTTTKDLLAHILATTGETVAAAGSYNNEIGVPLTAVRVGAASRFLVSEMGARGLGHITRLADIVRPFVGLVLNVGQAHIGEFGDLATTALAKGELIAGLPGDGWAVLNADDPLVCAMSRRHDGPTAWFSAQGEPRTGAGAALWATHVTLDDAQRPSFRLHLHWPGVASGEATFTVALRLPGRHQVANSLAALAAAIAAGVDPATGATALGRAVVTSRWRLESTERADGLLVVNDAYNANPDSMRAALDVAAGLVRARRRRSLDARLFAVLGDMLELGPSAPGAHRQAGRQAAAAGVDRLIAVGQFAPQMTAAFVEEAARRGTGAPVAEAHAVDRADQAVSLLADAAPADIVLVKASRGVGLESVAGHLLGAKD